MTERVDSDNATTTLETRLHAIRDRIGEVASRANRTPDEIHLVAVSKTVPVEVLRDAYALGLRVFGENRVQEAPEKIAALALPEIRWELIGHLQTNKAASAPRSSSTACRAWIASGWPRRSRRAARAVARRMPVLLEVNVAGEASKIGLRAR